MGIFVYGEIIKMHTMHEGNYAVYGENKLTKKQPSFWKLSSTANAMEALDDL